MSGNLLQDMQIFSLVLVLYVVDLISYGLWLGDAYHITQPPSDGRGAILAMTRALRQVSFIILYWFIFWCSIRGFMLAELPTYHVCMLWLLFFLSPQYFIYAIVLQTSHSWCHVLSVRRVLIESPTLVSDIKWTIVISVGVILTPWASFWVELGLNPNSKRSCLVVPFQP
jgi:hypothetical protein